MAEKFRSLQIFRNDAPFVLDTLGLDGLKGYIQGLLEGENPKLSLNDGEPISIRYKKSQDDNSVHCINGIAYNDGTNTTILWDELNIVTIPQTSTDTEFVTLSHTVNLDGTITFTVSNTLGDFNTVNGLATTEAVKTYVENQLSAFSPDAITAVEGGDTDFVSVSVSDKDTDGKVVVTADVTIADSIESADENNNGLVTAVQVKEAVETAVGSIVIPELPEYTIESIDVENDSLKTYQLFKGGVAVEGSKINIPKDYLVKDASIKTVETENEPEEGYKVGDKYFDFVINTKEGTTEDQHLYINAKDLVDTYTAGKDISITDNNAINVSLSNAITPNTTVGFVSPSNPIPAGASLEDVLRKILVKEVLATKVNPTNSLTVSGDAQREVGTALGTITLTPSYTDGYYKSSDTAVYTNTQFNTNNDTTNGRLNAGCTPGAITYYKGTATITDQVSEDDGFQYVDNTTTTKNETYSFQITTAYEASTVNECKTSSNAVQEISIDGGTTSKSDAKTVKFYHKTYVSPIQGLVWDAANNYLVKNGVEYVPSDELKNTMSEAGAFLTTTGQYKSETYTIPGTSSLCVIVPQNVTFSTYSTSDNNKTNLFGNFKKYETTNNLGITYDIYIYTNNGSAEFAVTGLTYSNIE
jgi:hypothetical protein